MLTCYMSISFEKLLPIIIVPTVIIFIPLYAWFSIRDYIDECR